MTARNNEEARTLLVAEFDDYVFAATHLSLTEADLMASISIIENVAKKYSKPFIIAGDLNAQPDSPFIKQLEKNFYICNNKGKSWPADNPRECLDYIAVYKSYGNVRRPGPAVCRTVSTSLQVTVATTSGFAWLSLFTDKFKCFDIKF